MPPCGYAMMQMFMYVCHDVNAPLWVCHDVNVHVGMSWCKCPLGACHDANVHLWVYHDTDTLIQTQFIQKFLLFSKRGFHNVWNQHILKTRFIIHEKSSSFLLKASKKMVITVRNLRMGYWLRIWWFGSKDLFSQFGWAKEVAHFQGLFLEKWILWKLSTLKRFIFSSWIWQFDRRQDPSW